MRYRQQQSDLIGGIRSILFVVATIFAVGLSLGSAPWLEAEDSSQGRSNVGTDWFDDPPGEKPSEPGVEPVVESPEAASIPVPDVPENPDDPALEVPVVDAPETDVPEEGPE